MGDALRLVVLWRWPHRRRLIIDHHRAQIPRHSVDKGRSRGANLERTYYIVPPGMNVIFRDEHGNELKR
jgi:hypothetical protein